MRRSEQNVRCERARVTSALAPDAELTELERRLLDAHLARCPECTAFAAGVEAATAVVRSTERVPLPHPIHVSAWRRRTSIHLRNVAATAAIVLMAFGLSSRGALPVQEHAAGARDSASTIVFAVDTQQELDEMRQVRRGELLAAAGIPALPARHPGTQPT
jgi:hypothetical protein